MAITPGTTNILAWDPGAANEETDSQYSGDSLRSGGASSGAILPSSTFNKLAHQGSLLWAAFAAALASKGYSLNDQSQSGAQAVFQSVLTQADMPIPVLSLGFSPTLTFDGSVAHGWDVTLYGNLTSSSFANLSVGVEYLFILQQDAVGGRTVSWPSQVAGAPQPDPTPNAVSMFRFIERSNGSVVNSGAQTVS